MPRFLATVAALFLLFSSGCSASREAPVRYVTPPLPDEPLPSAPREFRAAWVATVANIDWPSARGLPAESQQAELVALLDRAVEIGLNAIVFQVRPMADALYASDLEPWSIYVSGRQGEGPGYDPLAFAIEEAHRRGLELHAWFNPFRAGHPTNEGPYDSLHVSVSHPEWVRQYGNLLWLDPGVPEARRHSLQVMLDVVRRYEVDGVHMDDYFYPYPISDADGNPVGFPDLASWTASGFEGSRDDWRRANVDDFVRTLYDAVKAEAPHVRVGISPFGIWRPGHPEGVVGFDQYEGLYADARRWLHEGWVDYFTPQLYWAMESEGQPYPALLDWWLAENTHHRHLWPGNYTSRVIPEGAAYWGPEEVVRQVRHTRTTAATGNVHFSMRSLMPGVGQGEMLADSVYTEPALPPPTTWLGGTTPGVPMVGWEGTKLSFEPQGEEPLVWHVREWRDGWTIRVIPGHVRSLEFETDTPTVVVVAGVSRLGIEGHPAWAIRTVPVVE